MKFFKFLLSLGILSMSFSAFADIFCPDHLTCKNGQCFSLEGMPSGFQINYQAEYSFTGTLYFGQAVSNAEGGWYPSECQYRDAQGHTIAYLVSPKLLNADMSKQPNVWKQIGNAENYYCGLSDAPPYLGNPDYCPFKSAD